VKREPALQRDQLFPVGRQHHLARKAADQRAEDNSQVSARAEALRAGMRRKAGFGG